MPTCCIQQLDREISDSDDNDSMATERESEFFWKFQMDGSEKLRILAAVRMLWRFSGSELTQTQMQTGYAQFLSMLSDTTTPETF